jgi:CheY-like chemotaxis protein
MVRHGTIMLIENSAAVRRAFVDWLVLMGYTVVTAITATDALAKLRAGAAPCVILLDLQLPQRGAVEFRRAQVRDPHSALIPLVVYSALYDPRLSAAQLDADAYVYAAFDMEAFLDIIEVHCQSSHPRPRRLAA